MSTKSVIAVSALAIFYTCTAQLALARERVSAKSAKHHLLVEHCDPQRSSGDDVLIRHYPRVKWMEFSEATTRH